VTSLAVAPLTDVRHWAAGTGLEVLLFVLGALLLGRAITATGAALTRRIDEAATSGDALVRSEQAKHRHSVTQVLTWIALVLLYSVTAVTVMGLLGVPVTGLVAPATVLGVALGFGAQRIVQDLLAGFFIITERQYGFGDVVRISALGSPTGVTGAVEDISLRITRLRSSDGEVIIVPNGQIVQVTNLSRDWARTVIDVPLPPLTDIAATSDVLRRVGTDAFADPDLHELLLDEPTVMGVESLGVDEVNVRIVARTLPGKQFEVGRMLRARIAVALQAHDIQVRAAAVTTATAPVRS
jgi:small-conductance mechanosensitive channel